MTTVFLVLSLLAAFVFLMLFIQAHALANRRAEEVKELRETIKERDEEVHKRTKTERDLSAKNREALKQSEKLEAELTKLRTGQSREASPEDLAKANATLATLQKQIGDAKTHLSLLTEAVDLTDIAFYAPTFREVDSEGYRKAIEVNADRQKAMLQEGNAAVCTKTWTVGGDAKAGERMVKAITKLALRAFNGESDATIARVTWKNRETMAKRLEKSHESINDLVATWNIEISEKFLALKLEELQLVYEQEEMRQHERDEQRALKEQMREDAKARDEAERAKQDAERQERQAEMALAKARLELAKVREAERAEYEMRVAQLEAKLTEAHQLSERAISLAQLTKRGYVYIISNIGAFGEGIFKIGMTRRLDPQDRIDELGDASVPFEFDVHALIWSEDAPKLEADLHRQFSARRVNLINLRKEFFRVSISDIQAFCQDKKVTTQLTLLAEAKEFRQSEAMRRTAVTKIQEVSGAPT